MRSRKVNIKEANEMPTNIDKVPPTDPIKSVNVVVRYSSRTLVL